MTALLKYWRLVVAVLLLLFVTASVSLWAGYRKGDTAGSERVQSAWNKANLDALKMVINVERQAASNLAAKQKELNDEKENTRLAAIGSDNELDRMRQTIASLKHKLPATTSGTSAPNEALARSWDLLESCSKEYAAMGRVSALKLFS